MRKKTQQEGDVGLDTTDTELNESPQHLAARNLIRRATDGTLDEQTIVVGLEGNIKTLSMQHTNAPTVI